MTWPIDWTLAMISMLCWMFLALRWRRAARRWERTSKTWERTSKIWEDNSNFWRGQWLKDSPLRLRQRREEKMN